MEHKQQESSTVTDDPQARDLLRRAFERTARWQKDFKGFTADLTVNVNGKETSGPIIVKGPREVSVQLGDGETQKWAQEQLGMIAVHSTKAFELAYRIDHEGEAIVFTGSTEQADDIAAKLAGGGLRVAVQ